QHPPQGQVWNIIDFICRHIRSHLHVFMSVSIRVKTYPLRKSRHPSAAVKTADGCRLFLLDQADVFSLSESFPIGSPFSSRRSGLAPSVTESFVMMQST